MVQVSRMRNSYVRSCLHNHPSYSYEKHSRWRRWPFTSSCNCCFMYIKREREKWVNCTESSKRNWFNSSKLLVRENNSYDNFLKSLLSWFLVFLPPRVYGVHSLMLVSCCILQLKLLTLSTVPLSSLHHPVFCFDHCFCCTFIHALVVVYYTHNKWKMKLWHTWTNLLCQLSRTRNMNHLTSA